MPNFTSKPLIEHEDNRKWYEYQFESGAVEIIEQKNIDKGTLERAQQKANVLLQEEIAHFTQTHRNQNRGDTDWLETVTKKGTFADRLSVLQLNVQRSPVHAIQKLSKFVELVQKKGAKIREAHSITKALKELFINELLPPSRKLISFNQRPLKKLLNRGREGDKLLIIWQFEDQLKICYQQFLTGLQSLASSIVDGVAQAACREMNELLMERPEQEQFLLSALVNKLGHPKHLVGAKVAQMLEQLVQKHPNMRPVVVKQVEQLMFRKNISTRAQHYGLHFLSRVLLDAGEFELAQQVVQIYLRLFRILLLQNALNEHKILQLLIIGLNRAFPYARGQPLGVDLLEDVQSLYTIVQTAKFSTALSVLRLLFQIHNISEGLSDRFYCAFYRRLLNLPMEGNSQQMAPLFELLQKVLKNDLVESRVRAFLKRLFQVAMVSNSAFAAAILLTCHSILKERPQLMRLDSVLSAEIAENSGEPSKSEKRVGRGKNSDKKKKGEKEVKKEELVEGEEEDNAAGLKKPKIILEQKLRWFEANGADEDEHYADVKTESDKEWEGHEAKYTQMDGVSAKAAGWIHRRLHKQQQNNQHTAPSPTSTKIHLCGSSSQLERKQADYDPNGRNPLFAGADFALDTELYALARHYHPTVAMFARALIKGEPIHYKGDPLIDLGHMRFLDRFAFKNPKIRQNKASDDAKGLPRKMPPLFSHIYSPRGVKALNPTSQDYISRNTNEIPVDERFLHHFATFKFKKDGTAGRKERAREDEEDEVASLDSDEFDLLLTKFEPDESREVFDVDFSREFGEEADTKYKRKTLKRKRRSGMDESDGEEGGEGRLAGSDIDSSDSGSEEEENPEMDEDDGQEMDDSDAEDMRDFDEDLDLGDEEEEELELD